MALYQVVIASILLTAWISQSSARYYQVDYDPYYQEPVYYSFEWEVKDDYSGNDYRQKETRDGRLTTGLYQVLLPDGRHQTVNYRVDKDSGFMADVSYQHASNYFNFQSNYQQPAPVVAHQPQQKSYEPKVVYHQEPARYVDYYPASTKPMIPKKMKPTTTTTTTTMAPPTSPHYYVVEEDWAAKEDWIANKEAVSHAKYVAPENRESQKDRQHQQSPVLFPLYRVDYYAAKAGKTKMMAEDADGTYAVDASGSTYIKPAALYSVPDKLGSYEVKHRKATVRKPSKSDYQAPDSLIAGH